MAVYLMWMTLPWNLHWDGRRCCATIRAPRLYFNHRTVLVHPPLTRCFLTKKKSQIPWNTCRLRRRRCDDGSRHRMEKVISWWRPLPHRRAEILWSLTSLAVTCTEKTSRRRGDKEPTARRRDLILLARRWQESIPASGDLTCTSPAPTRSCRSSLCGPLLRPLAHGSAAALDGVLPFYGGDGRVRSKHQRSHARRWRPREVQASVAGAEDVYGHHRSVFYGGDMYSMVFAISF